MPPPLAFAADVAALIAAVSLILPSPTAPKSLTLKTALFERYVAALVTVRPPPGAVVPSFSRSSLTVIFEVTPTPAAIPVTTGRMSVSTIAAAVVFGRLEMRTLADRVLYSRRTNQ